MASPGVDPRPPAAPCEFNMKEARQEHDTLASCRTQEGWVVAELCSQCTNAKQHGTGQVCSSLLCAFVRGHSIIDCLINILTSWSSIELENDDNEVTTHLIPLYDEAEKKAVGLLWQMSAMIR